MSEAEVTSPKRDRSPSFPYIGLAKAVERTQQLYDNAKRYEVRIADAAGDWNYGAKSSATLQTVGALLAYGLIEDSGSGEYRKIKVSDAGWRILEDERPGVRQRLMAEAALKPKLILEIFELWNGAERPDDSHAISQLKFDHRFTDEAASKFLRVYDETIQFVGVELPDTECDKEPEVGGKNESSSDLSDRRSDGLPSQNSPVEPLRKQRGVLMDGERELITGLLSKGTHFRLIVSGAVGEREIERLIKKLELDKEILADSDEGD